MKATLTPYFDRAVKVLDQFGIVKKEGDESRLAQMLQEVVSLDEPKVLSVARIVERMSAFNELVRNNIEGFNVGTRYEGMTKMFDSIREDSKTLVDQLSDGKIDWKERTQNFYMKCTRGTIHGRFEKIKTIYQQVTNETRSELERENMVLQGYMDFRLALKEAEIWSQELYQKQQQLALEYQKKFTDAATAVTQYAENDGAERGRLEMQRDEAKREFEREDKRYQLLKDISENLRVGYNVGETLMAKLKQTHDVKDRVYAQTVTFFTTNEHVFTTMDAVYNSQHGLHEATQTLESMKAGVNKGLEDIAQLGTQLEEAGLKAGYGPTVAAQSVQKLVDSVVSYQENSLKIITQLRNESATNAAEVARIVNEGKQRSAKALESYLTVRA